MEKDSKDISEILRRYIGSRSIREFSELSGVSESWLSKMVNGFLKGKPNVKTLLKFCSVKSEDHNIRPKDIFYLFGYNDYGDAYQNETTKTENDASSPSNDCDKTVITTTITTSDPIFLEAITRFLGKKDGKVFQLNVKIEYFSQ